ncbi:response regulator [Candidatus Woesebacteria bacterium]|nr:MAG: response regulator [Candidatus Woesebacteria bacterium]
MTKILLVDDDKLMVKMYLSKFKIDGYEVETAFNGQEALSKVVRSNPDLILLDIMMPEMNGLDVLKELKANEKTKNIPVILLTNVGGSDEDVKAGLELGAVAYLIKASYTPKEVIQKVKEVLEGYKKDIPEVKTEIKEEVKK